MVEKSTYPVPGTLAQTAVEWLQVFDSAGSRDVRQGMSRGLPSKLPHLQSYEKVAGGPSRGRTSLPIQAPVYE